MRNSAVTECSTSVFSFSCVLICETQKAAEWSNGFLIPLSVHISVPNASVFSLLLPNSCRSPSDSIFLWCGTAIRANNCLSFCVTCYSCTLASIPFPFFPSPCCSDVAQHTEEQLRMTVVFVEGVKVLLLPILLRNQKACNQSFYHPLFALCRSSNASPVNASPSILPLRWWKFTVDLLILSSLTLVRV